MLTEKERDDLEKGKPSWKIFAMAFSILLTIVPIGIHFLYQRAQRKAISQNHSFAIAEIIQLEYRGGKGRHYYKTRAAYQVNGISFTCVGKAFRTLRPDQQDSLIGLKLPVIYEQTKPSNGELLYSEAQFNRFNLEFPDSLSWTRLYFLE